MVAILALVLFKIAKEQNSAEEDLQFGKISLHEFEIVKLGALIFGGLLFAFTGIMIAPL